jgi:sugar phosphate isomerase/epimerase
MKIGVMNNPGESVYEEAVAFGKAAFDFIDLTIEGPQARDVDTAKMGAILKQHNLAVVGHTDPCLPWAYPIRTIRRACLDELERCARIFSALGAGIMNIHPCYFCPPAMRALLVDLNIEALKPIAEMATSCGLKLAFENYMNPFDRVSTFKSMLNEVAGMSLHLDFGHTKIGKDNHTVFCDHLGEHIAHVHFSDNRGKADNHMPLGVGSIDWEKAVASLKNTGYDGTITLEVFCDDPKMRFHYLDLSRKYVQKLWHKKTDALISN